MKILISIALLLVAQSAFAVVPDGSISTAKLASGAVTQAKRAALGQQISSSSGVFSTSSGTLTAVTNLSASLTTTGRPVFVGIMAGDASSNTLSVDSGNQGTVAFFRDSTQLTAYKVVASGGTTGVGGPASAAWFIDVPSAGTYTYSVKAATSSGGSIYLNGVKLVAFEL